MSRYNVNVMDIRIVDLQGQEYDINDIVVSGNDFISIRIKKPSEDYIPIERWCGMTEKRFTLNKGLYECLDMTNCLILPILDDGRELSVINVVELLNELHEENTMLKEQRHEDINELSVIAMRFKALEKENERLRRCINEIYTIARSGLNDYESICRLLLSAKGLVEEYG